MLFFIIEVGISFSYSSAAEFRMLNGYVPDHIYDNSKNFLGRFEVFDIGEYCRRDCSVLSGSGDTYFFHFVRRF